MCGAGVARAVMKGGNGRWRVAHAKTSKILGNQDFGRKAKESMRERNGGDYAVNCQVRGAVKKNINL